MDKPGRPYLTWSPAAVSAAAEIVHDVTGKSGSAAQTAIRFVLQHDAVSSAVVGIRTLAQLEDIAASVDAGELSGQEMDRLTHAAYPQHYLDHR